jgi:putative hydrolase of the HAD superfamily
MKAKGCMFDFSGTVFRIEPCADWLRGALEAAGVEAPDDEIAYWAERLERFGAQPGGATPAGWRPEAEAAWEQRDLTAELHRHAYRVQSRASGLPWDIHDVLYDRHMSPAAWRPYPDAAEVLAELRARGVPVAVVSNIGWDLRPVFREHGLDRFVDVFVLSFEHGVRKPDPRLFRIACEGLGLPPETVAMVGDDPHADTGASALGCPVHLVDPLPVDQRPDGLRPVLAAFGQAG